jgi:hypothetical protein
MPQPVHDIFSGKIQELIIHKILSLERQLENSTDETLMAMKQISRGYTSDLTWKDKTKKSPDASITYNGQKWPLCVIEIANSEKSSHLRQKAESYMDKTGGRIRTVITFEIDYQNPNTHPPATRTGSYSLYRAVVNVDGEMVTKRPAHRQYFRLQNPTASTPDGALALRLSDLCPREVLDIEDDADIKITHAEMEQILLDAEKKHNDYLFLPESPGIERRLKREYDQSDEEDGMPDRTRIAEEQKAFDLAVEKTNRRRSDEDETFRKKLRGPTGPFGWRETKPRQAKKNPGP